MTIAVGDVIRVVGKLNDANGSLIENAYYWHHAGTSSVTEANFLAAVEPKLSTIWANLDTYLPTSLTPVEIECDKVEWSGGQLVTVAPVGTVAWTTWTGGTAGGDVLPPQDCMLVQFPTLTPRVRGMKYIGPFAESAQQGGILSGGALADLAAWAGEYLSPMTVVAELFQSGVMSKKVFDFVDFISDVVKSAVATQRRRKAGRGA